jgi:hypothetical protein
MDDGLNRRRKIIGAFNEAVWERIGWSSRAY